MTFKMQQLQANSVSFANTADITDKVRFVSTNQSKKIGGISTLHVRSEVIRNKLNHVVVGENTGDDQLAIRTAFSGTVASEAALIALWTEYKTQVDAGIAAGMLKGFIVSDVAL